MKAKKTLKTICVAVLFSAVTFLLASAPPESSGGLPRIAPPPAGKLYHAVMAEDPLLGDEQVSPESVAAYEKAVGKKVAIVYFTHNWFRGRAFPIETAAWISARGCIPFIRLMLRSDYRQDRADKKYSLSKIISGKFDADLKSWAVAARDFGSPLLVEYGTEFNGRWFPWNGRWNGGGNTGGFGDPNLPDGPERFVAAYRHIVDIMRAEGADNITWVWHANASDWPQTEWNRFENYYPGDEYVDWVAVSAYGPQVPLENWGDTFRRMIDPWYKRQIKLAPDKPIYVAEFGCTHTSVASDENPKYRADKWARAALRDLFARRWPAVIGFSWWNEAWENDNNPEHDTNMRVQDWAPLKKAFRKQFRKNASKMQKIPIITGQTE